MASHSQKTFKRMEANYLPINLTYLVDNLCSAEVQATRNFQTASTAAERCAAFLDYYALEVRLDVVDCFKSKKHTNLGAQLTDGLQIPPSSTPSHSKPEEEDDASSEIGTRTVADVEATTVQEEYDQRREAARKRNKGVKDRSIGEKYATAEEQHKALAASVPPLMRKISEHTFDAMRYGMFLPSQLILVADEANLPKNFENCMEDHVFVVLHIQDTEEGSVIAVPIFRFVLRTEGKSAKGHPGLVRAPTFVLRTVTISGKDHMKRFTELATADGVRHRVEQNSAAAQTGYAHAPSQATVEAATMFSTLKLLWEECVLNAFPLRVPYFLPDNFEDDQHTAADASPDPAAGDEMAMVMPSCVPGSRMRQRIQVQTYNRDLRVDWTEGAELRRLSEAGERQKTKLGTHKSTSTPVHPSCRVVMRDTRSGRNFVEEADLCAFLPSDGECASLARYSSVGEERIRVWVLKACLTAEVRDVHQLLFDIDTSMLISQSVELLSLNQEKLAKAVFAGWSDSRALGGARAQEEEEEEEKLLAEGGASLVHLYALRIVLETIEDFLRHSGILWRVCVALRDIPQPLARRLLKSIQRQQQDAELRQIVAELGRCSDSNNNGEGPIMLGPQDGTGVPEPYSPPAPGMNVIVSASCTRTPVTEGKLYDLFKALDANKNGVLSVRELTELFKRKNSTELRYGKQGTCVKQHERRIMQRVADEEFVQRAELLAPLDQCGLPDTDTDIRKFVLGFVKMDPMAAKALQEGGKVPRWSSTTSAGTTNSALKDLHLLDSSVTDDLVLSFDEFSVMMLSLARR